MKRLIKFMVLSCILGLFAPCNSMAMVGNRCAILIGIANHPDLPELKFPESDMRQLKQQLINQAYFKEENIALCVGTAATFANFKESLGKFSQLTPNDLLLVYFSGHGTAMKKDNESKRYYFFYEAKYGQTFTYISEDDLKEWLAKIKARKVLVLDACYSGISPVSGGKASVLPDSFDPGPVDVIISACQSNEMAHDGVLARNFSKALEKADANQEGAIMLSAVYNFVATNVPAEKDDQHPQISPGSYTDFPLIEDIGILEIDTAPIRGVEVCLNGESIGTTPIKDKEYKPGVYEVELRYGKIVTKMPLLTIKKGLNPKKTYGFDIRANITGRVVDDVTGEPVVGAAITPIGGGVFGAATDQNGEFVVKVSAGEYRGIVIMGAAIEQKIIKKEFKLEEGEIYPFGEIKVAAKSAKLEVSTNVSNALCFINGNLKGNTGINRKILLELKPGEYELTVKKDKYSPDSRKINLNIGEEQKLEVSLIPKQPLMNVAIGLGNPYLSLKVGKKWNIEARGAVGSDINVYSGRLLRNFSQIDKKKGQNLNIFAGIEGGAIAIDRPDTAGISSKGTFGYLFIGGEYFITDRLAFVIDMGPVSINLTENKTSISACSLEYIVNLGINFYLR